MQCARQNVAGYNRLFVRCHSMTEDSVIAQTPVAFSNLGSKMLFGEQNDGSCLTRQRPISKCRIFQSHISDPSNETRFQKPLECSPDKRRDSTRGACCTTFRPAIFGVVINMLIDNVRSMSHIPYFTSSLRADGPMSTGTDTKSRTRSRRIKFDPNQHWFLIGEGCSSIVLGEKSINAVLRFRKIKPTKSPERESVFTKVNEEDIAGLVSFSEGVIFQSCSELRGWLTHVQIAEISHSFQDYAKSYFQSTLSPRTMMPIACDTIRFDRALLMPLLTCLQKPQPSSTKLLPNTTYTVELKPKEGTLPSGLHVHPARRSYSKFFLKQQQKFTNGEISVVSNYSPLDLFSRDRSRMKRAIRDLIQHPQNNLKVFRNEALVFGPDTREEFQQFLAEMFAQEPSSVNSAELNDCFANVVVDMLCRDGVLDALLDLQKTLVPVDIDDVYPVYEKLKACLANDVLLNDALQVYSSDYEHSRFWTLSGLEYAGLNDEMQQAVKLVRNFLVAATLKDCSILLTFQPVDSDVKSSEDMQPTNDCATLISSIGGCKFQYEIHLVDLDPKPFDRVARYFKEAKQLELLSLPVAEKEC